MIDAKVYYLSSTTVAGLHTWLPPSISATPTKPTYGVSSTVTLQHRYIAGSPRHRRALRHRPTSLARVAIWDVVGVTCRTHRASAWAPGRNPMPPANEYNKWPTNLGCRSTHAHPFAVASLARASALGVGEGVHAVRLHLVLQRLEYLLQPRHAPRRRAWRTARFRPRGSPRRTRPSVRSPSSVS